MKELLILGIGNIVLRDEGVGICVINNIINRNILPEGVDIMDGATGGYFLLNDIVDYKKVIIVDASLENTPAGTVKVSHPKYSYDYPPMLSAHEFGLKNMIDAMIFIEKIPDIYLITISVSEFQEMGFDLSEDVKKAIPIATEKVLHLSKKILNKERVEIF
ncbi:MAG: hydrogenase maturation protease [Bacteroidales bacterium]|nr:hydrogenase maturation protease [Bacteroidales bacterium]